MRKNDLDGFFSQLQFFERQFFSKTVGSISNDFEKITTDDKGHMSAKFSNSVGSIFVIFNLFLCVYMC